jgi:predicted RNA-binding Zn-ribbon protein involved in translation (DUF1610 family)
MAKTAIKGKCPKCGEEIDKLFVFQPAIIIGILVPVGDGADEQPPEDFQTDELEKSYHCPKCGEELTVDEGEAVDILQGRA